MFPGLLTAAVPQVLLPEGACTPPTMPSPPFMGQPYPSGGNITVPLLPALSTGGTADVSPGVAVTKSH